MRSARNERRRTERRTVSSTRRCRTLSTNCPTGPPRASQASTRYGSTVGHLWWWVPSARGGHPVWLPAFRPRDVPPRRGRQAGDGPAQARRCRQGRGVTILRYARPFAQGQETTKPGNPLCGKRWMMTSYGATARSISMEPHSTKPWTSRFHFRMCPMLLRRNEIPTQGELPVGDLRRRRGLP